MKTGIAKSSGAQSEKGPRSLYDSLGRRKTPEPTTALMHIAISPPKPTARTSFTCSLSLLITTSSNRPSRQRIPHRAVAQHDLAVHHDIDDPLPKLVRLLVRREIAHVRFVEHDDVCFHPRTQNAAIADADAIRGLRRHLAHRLFEREELLVAHVMSGHARGGAVRARMHGRTFRALLRRRRAGIRSDRYERLLQRVLHVVFIHREEDDRGG